MRVGSPCVPRNEAQPVPFTFSRELVSVDRASEWQWLCLANKANRHRTDGAPRPPGEASGLSKAMRGRPPKAESKRVPQADPPGCPSHHCVDCAYTPPNKAESPAGCRAKCLIIWRRGIDLGQMTSGEFRCGSVRLPHFRGSFSCGLIFCHSSCLRLRSACSSSCSLGVNFSKRSYSRSDRPFCASLHSFVDPPR